MKLDDSVRFLRGVGPRRAELLEKAGLRTAEDLLYHLPFRYEDRRCITRARDARGGMEVTMLGRVRGIREQTVRRGRRKILHAVFEDGSGWITLVWFHHAEYWHKRLAERALWMLNGRIDADPRGGLQIVHPELERIRTVDRDGHEEPSQADLAAHARIIPVYQKPGEIPVGTFRGVVDGVVPQVADQAKSCVPEPVRKRLYLGPVPEALRYVHMPPRDADPRELERCSTRAHRLLIFEELFALQIGMRLRRAQREKMVGRSMGLIPERVEAFFAGLPFEPTGAQRRVCDEIARDLAAKQPMNRLVHGDVGAGKTVVAFAAAIQAVAAGFQVAVMAPTELLAEQHFATMSNWATGEGFKVALLVGSLSGGNAAKVRAAAAAGEIDIVIGTHALVQEATSFARLGLAIVDEQHRFGVLQRAALGVGETETLLLSATPIPRTLALTLYGDLEVSALDEMPPGRTPVTTRVLRASQRETLWKRMAAVLSDGAQAYVVYPQVEESEKTDLAAATEMAAKLQRGPFREFRVGLLHGRMKQAEKDAVMRRFRAGDLDVLVATTVIEVGIDVPNASIMIVEHAERFGLAQLHQLRGRVGRGQRESFCCLILDPSAGRDAAARVAVLEQTGDGFEVADADLQQRGPGEYLGTRQAGVPVFRAANLVRDADALEEARIEADRWLQEDPDLVSEHSAELRRALQLRWGDRLRLAEVG